MVYDNPSFFHIGYNKSVRRILSFRCDVRKKLSQRHPPALHMRPRHADIEAPQTSSDISNHMLVSISSHIHSQQIDKHGLTSR